MTKNTETAMRTKAMEQPITEAKLNEIRGKAMVGHATKKEIMQVFYYLDYLVNHLDVTEYDDTYGTEGWRHFFNMPEG